MAQAEAQLAPEMLIPRLGEVLLDKALVSEGDLQKALTYQRDQAQLGKYVLLGQALLALKLLDRAALDQAVTEQILQLRSALEAANHSLEQRVQERTAELQEALQRLSELSQLKANFISNISHELRTPLTHITGYLDLISTGSLGPITAEQQAALRVGERAAARLEAMIEDLIMFSLAARGELSLKPDRTVLRGLIEASARIAAQKGEERGVSVRAVVEDNLPAVRADADKITWVLAQLLDNGVKFTPPGGQVEISARLDGNHLVTIAVRDSGIGIPSGRLQEVLEPFHQLDGSSTRRYGGTGLGLALVRQIVEAHGSLLEIESVEHSGSVFRFPLVAAEE